MQLHPRYFTVESARLEISEAVSSAAQKHELTYGELLHILADMQLRWAKYLVREERHPDSDERGDEK